MRIAVSADERTGVADQVAEALRARGHDPILHGALSENERDDWAWASEAAARDVAEGRADQAVVCCWTGTGASIAANKVPGVRAAACYSVAVARNSREHNGANVLSLGSKTITSAEMREIVQAWLATELTEERHQKRVAKIQAVERQYLC